MGRHFGDWPLNTGGGGGLHNGRGGGPNEVLPLQKGGGGSENIVAMLKGEGGANSFEIVLRIDNC